MAGKAHAHRQRRKPSVKHNVITCRFCLNPTKKVKNSNGHRHNPAANKKQKK